MDKVIQADRDLFKIMRQMLTEGAESAVAAGEYDGDFYMRHIADARCKQSANLIKALEDAEIDFISGLTMPTKESREQCLKRGLTAVRAALAQYRERVAP